MRRSQFSLKFTAISGQVRGIAFNSILDEVLFIFFIFFYKIKTIILLIVLKLLENPKLLLK